MEGTRHGESAVYGHAPPFDARSREQRHQRGAARSAGEGAAPAARSTLGVHTRGAGVAGRGTRARRHYRRSSHGAAEALSRAPHTAGNNLTIS